MYSEDNQQQKLITPRCLHHPNLADFDLARLTRQINMDQRGSTWINMHAHRSDLWNLYAQRWAHKLIVSKKHRQIPPFTSRTRMRRNGRIHSPGSPWTRFWPWNRFREVIHFRHLETTLAGAGSYSFMVKYKRSNPKIPWFIILIMFPYFPHPNYIKLPCWVGMPH